MENDMRDLPRHLASLQYLRGIAALSVVYFHAVIQVSHIGGQAFWPEFGACGVDIFFVLSGLVMWLTTERRSGKPFDFILRRVVRIVPLYWALTVAAVCVAIIAPNMLRSTVFQISHFTASLFFIPWPNPAAVTSSSELLSPVIVPGWTLNIEMMFYVLFSFCLIARTRFRPPLLLSMLLALYYIGIFSRAYGLYSSFYATNMLFEFFFGVALGAYRSRLNLMRVTPVCAALSLSFIALFSLEIAKTDIPRVLTLGIPSTVIVACCLFLEKRRRIPHLPVLESVGDASYSIYLSHIFVIAGLRMLLSRFEMDIKEWEFICFVPIAVIISTVCGMVIRKYVEAPLVKIANLVLRGKQPSPDGASIGPSAGAV